MPANPKYLTKSRMQRFAKISAGLLGGYLIAALLHISLALWLPDPKMVLITSVYSIYLVWVLCLIIPFLLKNGWMAWAIYLGIILVLAVTVYFGKSLQPLTA